ncbi:hypothetical protein BDZ91DRAFT_716905, partial [Kalaharituber pfeilii]
MKSMLMKSIETPCYCLASCAPVILEQPRKQQRCRYALEVGLNQVVSVCCFRVYCWYNYRRWLVDISTVRALTTDVNL